MAFRIIPTILLIALQMYLLHRYWKWSDGRSGFIALTRIPVLILFLVFNAALLVVAHGVEDDPAEVPLPRRHQSSPSMPASSS